MLNILGLQNMQQALLLAINNDGKYDGDYALTFVYEDQNPKNAVSVKVSGNLQFYDLKDPVVSNFINTGSAAGG